MENLPIYEVLDRLRSGLQKKQTLILEAPPGAGKSTVVPISFFDEEWLGEKMIIMLEPRRVAARMTASRMADLLDEKVGESVGYIVRNDNCRSKKTKILVVTEAVLVRMLQNDQSLKNIAMVIFDEFHERSIHTDLSLALTLQVQELLRDDLKILIMSATLNSSRLLNLLGDDTPVITSKGKLYGVENIYLSNNIKQPDPKNINELLSDTVINSLKNDTGDILVFLAGTKEIKTLEGSLKGKIKDDIDILPLYSNLSKKAQDRALLPSNKRKVILSTNIAQTSLTIEGVRVVIDTGLEKLSNYNYSNGMDHLELKFISNDSAVQRAGRAGRTSSGKCYRLWHQKKILEPSTRPEILRSDILGTVLELALWGAEDFHELKWLDTPPKRVIDETKEILKELSMLDGSFNITGFGKDTLSLGVHPRLGFMVLKGYEQGLGFEACISASLIESKDIFKNGYQNSNLVDRFEIIFENSPDKSYVNSFSAKEVLKLSNQYFKKICAIKGEQEKNSSFEAENIAELLLFAYPDRLAKLRKEGQNSYKLSNGKGALINYEDNLFNEKLLVVTSLNAKEQNSYINHCIPISLQTIKDNFSYILSKKESVTYNRDNKKFEIKEHLYFLGLELENYPATAEDKEFKDLFIPLLKKEGLGFLSWSNKAVELKRRVEFLNKHYGGIKLPDLSESGLLTNLEEWLGPYLENINSIKEAESLELYNILLGMIGWEEQQLLEKLSPGHIKVPSGSNIKIEYENPDNPVLKVRIQEVFGLHDTPKILNGTFPLQIHLLSPANRPIQITYDLKSFWDNSYEEVAKELRGRYKKHYWPKDPYEAVATNKTKKYMDKDAKH